MEQGNDNNYKKSPSVFSKTIRAGRRRTYFFDVRTTKANDFYITLTESKKKFNDDGYERHKIFLYKEDFNKFLEAMTETIDHVKNDLLPEYDFDEFSNNYDDDYDDEDGHNSDSKASYSFKEEKEVSNSTADEPKNAADDSEAEVAKNEAPEVDDDELKWD